MDRVARERAALLGYQSALGAGPGQLHRAAVEPLPDLAERVRWWSSLLPNPREVVMDDDLGIFCVK